MSPEQYQKYRETQLENGRLFQDFAADALYAAGFPIVTYSSQLYQYAVGESRGGWEFKYDMKYEKTGNLWIEVAEKAKPREGAYYPSGIQAKDNTVFYVIGDYDILFIFPKSVLMLLYQAGRFKTIENGTKTSVGFLLAYSDAVKYAAFVLKPNCSEIVKDDIRELKTRAIELYRNLKPSIENFTLPLFPDEPLQTNL